jgi:uncharacterized protein (TIGR03083 family)
MLQKTSPILVVDRFPALLEALLDLLTGISDEEWQRPVHGGEWTVKDLAQHLLGDEINILSGKRDRYSEKLALVGSWEELVVLINRRNAVWVDATRRMSPRLVCELLRATGDQVNAYFHQVDLYATGGPVNWAGPEPSPVWLDVAREFTERWHHQQHIRDAIGRPGCTEAYFLTPVLATFMHALPQTFRGVDAPEGTGISLAVTGEAGGTWSVMREQDRWQLYRGKPDHSQAEVELPEDTTWRLFTKGIPKEAARQMAKLSGDLHLAEKVLETVAIIA